MPEPLYTILVSNEPFKFTRSQLESEPDNYFLTYFFGSFAEASRGINELAVEKEPILFKLIQAHLRGYNIFPISDGCVPSYMTKEVMVENLLMEAEFYGLEKLVEKIKEYKTQICRVQASSERKHHEGEPIGHRRSRFNLFLLNQRYDPREREACCQSLGKEEYLAIFHGLAANSSTGQYMLLRGWQHLKETGYSVSMTWIHNSDNYALLVSDDSTSDNGRYVIQPVIQVN